MDSNGHDGNYALRDKTRRACQRMLSARPSRIRERATSASTSKPRKVAIPQRSCGDAAPRHSSFFRRQRRANDAQLFAQGSSPNKTNIAGVPSTIR
jgi:hypothetical protein